MKRFAILLALGAMFLAPVTAHAVSVTIDGGNDGTIEFSVTDVASPVLIANSATGTANYGGFVISNLGTTPSTLARVEAIDGSTDKLNLTGLKITNTNSTTATIVITYSAIFSNSGGASGFAGQALAGAFSAANANDNIASRAWIDFPGCDPSCPTYIDAPPLRNPPGQISAANTRSFGGTAFQEVVAVTTCNTGSCYEIFGTTTVTLLGGAFITLSGSHDIEVAATQQQILNDFSEHLAEFHPDVVPEPSSLYLLLSGLAPLAYFFSRKRKP
jgi:PEP-CTERM motif-containing protein